MDICTRGSVQRNFFRNCFWEVSLDLFGEPECGYWPQPQIGLTLWSLSTTGDRWQDTETLMCLSVLPDESVLRSPDWVAPVLFVLRRCAGSVWSNAAAGMRRGLAIASGARRRCSTGMCSSILTCSGSGRSLCTDMGGGEGKTGLHDVPDRPPGRAPRRSGIPQS